ncbi:hypothetical protein CEXT_100871 [Caerostris extrusa]|uniref:Uncharacterized protein n=1 Tax=Caerostris extrusa TaxID=172846 RepID=A0AAV4MD81_CAEEX|nr:hypothetical protein CEXT_100871 [Caerostris extrusa]
MKFKGEKKRNNASALLSATQNNTLVSLEVLKPEKEKSCWAGDKLSANIGGVINNRRLLNVHTSKPNTPSQIVAECERRNKSSGPLSISLTANSTNSRLYLTLKSNM